MKLYTTTSNCVRAAKVALGAGAQRDVHFTITKTDDVHTEVGDSITVAPGGYRFDAIEGAPAVPAVEAKAAKPKAKAAKVIAVKPAKAAKATADKPAKKVAAKRPAKAAAKPKGTRKPNDGTVGHQPSYQALLALVSRASGVTNADAAERLKLKNHTVRSMFCRLDREYKFDKEKVNGKLVRTNPRKLKGAAREVATEAAALAVQ